MGVDSRKIISRLETLSCIKSLTACSFVIYQTKIYSRISKCEVQWTRSKTYSRNSTVKQERTCLNSAKGRIKEKLQQKMRNNRTEKYGNNILLPIQKDKPLPTSTPSPKDKTKAPHPYNWSQINLDTAPASNLSDSNTGPNIIILLTDSWGLGTKKIMVLSNWSKQ